MNAPVTTSATIAYNQSADRIQALLKRLENGLQIHAEKAGQRPRDWGFVGDLGSIETRLQEIVQNFQP